MSLAFVHLSDIHFGQEKGGRLRIHEDVRERLLDDIADIVQHLPLGKADGIIVTGDLTYSGMIEEYEKVGQWLDEVADRVGCAVTAVQVVPGNHDIHRKSICRSSEWMLSELASKGETALDSFLADEQDREVLYGRLRPYRKFAEGYNCPLDGAGGTAGQKIFDIAPRRTLRFIGLNSALTCGTKDEPGKLLLGARQWVLPRSKGEELVVLCHHPLHWFRDSKDALRYVHSRARVFISGHEHSPRLAVTPVEDGCDLLTLEAGATTPPEETEIYTFTYNILEFSWDEATDGLRVDVKPRIWSGTGTRFEANHGLPGSGELSRLLGCPNFRALQMADPHLDGQVDRDPTAESPSATPSSAATTDIEERRNGVTSEFSFLLLRFFRDLTGAQRLAVLVKLGALPEDWFEPLNHSAERRALDLMNSSDRLEELKAAIEEVASMNKPETTNND
ncbi:MAG TPA: metallophosphoesterase [Candidatus Angelobacter sp.]